MIKAVLFDMDGLVLDTEKYYQSCWRKAAEEYGFSMSRETALNLRSCAKEVAEPLLIEQFGKTFRFDEIRERRRVLVEEAVRTQGIDKMPYTDEILDFLKEKRIPTHIVTATNEERCKWFLELAGLSGAFDKLTCASMVKNGKPAPDVYLYALERAKVSPDEAIALEDSPNGVRAAYAAGLRVIMVSALDEGEETESLCIKKTANLREALNFLKSADL